MTSVEAGGKRRRDGRSIALEIAKWAVSIGLLAFILHRVDAPVVLNRIKTLSPVMAVGVIALLLAHVWVSATRWVSLMRQFGVKADKWQALRATLLERFLNQALPSTVSGDAARVMVMRGPEAPLAAIVQSVIADRLFAIGGIVAFHVVALPQLLKLNAGGSGDAVFIGIAAVSCIGLAALLAAPRKWLARDGKGALARIGQLVVGLQDVFRSPRAFVGIVGRSVLAQALVVTCFLWLAWGLQVPLTVIDAIAIVPVIALLNLLPITVGGWGAREGAAVALFALVGISAENALAVSILFGLSSIVTACIGGVVWLCTQARTPPQAATG
jgi:uncharacterized membrane protein YbhN (UPF0104 family)